MIEINLLKPQPDRRLTEQQFIEFLELAMAWEGKEGKVDGVRGVWRRCPMCKALSFIPVDCDTAFCSRGCYEKEIR